MLPPGHPLLLLRWQGQGGDQRHCHPLPHLHPHRPCYYRNGFKQGLLCSRLEQHPAKSNIAGVGDDGVGDVGDGVDNEIGHAIDDDNEDGVLNPIQAWV